jgi:DNA repair protein RecN (Recombination protein N)
VLRHLRVTNFAILSDVTLELGEGMNALTGETGAGKSLIVEAVNLLRGGRASADIPRAGADEAVVEAIFEIPADLAPRIRGVLDGAGLPLGPDDDAAARARREAAGEPAVSDVLVRRVIQRGGRSRTYVNGALTTASRLAELGGMLVDLSGQHQHQGLVDPDRHREILDLFATVVPDGRSEGKKPRLPAASLLATMAEAWEALRAIDAQIAALGGDEKARSERADYLRYQLDELDGARLETGEDERLAAERTRLAAVDQLQAGARAAEDLLYGGDDSAIDRLAAASRELERLLRLDGDLEPCARLLNEARALVEDVASQLRHYADRLEGDPERLSWVEDRLELIRRLVRKHGLGVGELIGRAGELRGELDGLDRRDERLAELTASRAAAEARALAAARALSESRTQAARRLEREVAAALAELGMAAARLHVVIEPRPLGPTGSDRVELMLASNKGEDKKPLAKVASGGELSRIMLAMKLVLRRADEVATYVFDEVDTGVGGATASAVGGQIRAVADHRQVLCVTHLPQIAAYADHHFHVEKAEVAGRTETRVKRLGAGARKDELARMLGGQATTKAKAHAAELLAEAARMRPRAAS